MSILFPSLLPRSGDGVRVFVSSAFDDMGIERERLVKHVFPRLRQVCEARGIGWDEVDLRWGVPDDEKAQGRLLEICFREIDRCRPFFIGILGQYYGSAVEAPTALAERLPWLRNDVGLSCTELEIRYALLSADSAPMESRFYFREPSAGGTAPEDPRLMALKGMIEASGSSVGRYSTVDEFGDLVLRDWLEVLDRRFPGHAPVTPDQREREAHADFLRKRTTCFVPESGTMERLDRLVRRGGPPLLIRGETGAGKSSLVANWLAGLAVLPVNRPKSLLSGLLGRSGRTQATVGTTLVHAVGAPGSGREWPAILRFLTCEAMRAAGTPGPPPDDPETLFAAFVGAVRTLGARGPVLLVLDGIDQVAEPSPSSPLAWLPDSFPDPVRVVATLRPGPACDALVARGWQVVDLPPLARAARRMVAQELLANSGKRLPLPLLERLADAQRAALPLYLRVLLEELRVFGSHDQLSSHLDDCLKRGSALELFDAVLGRLERDHPDPPGLVCEALGLVAYSRAGLTERDLLAMLGSPSRPLPIARWSPLRAALDEFLLESGGCLSLFHPVLYDAVRRRYLSGPGREKQVRGRIAAYFQRHGGPHAVGEIPWQLSAAAEWEALFEWLAEPAFLKAAWLADPAQVKRYWAQVAEHLGRRPADAYGDVVAHPERHPDAASTVAVLLRETGFPAQALRIARERLRRRRDGGPADAAREELAAATLSLRQLHRLSEALDSLKEEEALCRGSRDLAALQANLGNQGVILRDLDRLEEALDCHREEERICGQLRDGTGVTDSWLNQAAVHLLRGDLAVCATLLDRCQRSFDRRGDALGVQAALEVRGRLLARRGDREGALACHERQERVCREVMYAPGIRSSLLYQARMCHELLWLERAVALLDRHEELCREAADTVSRARGLLVRATVFGNAGLLSQAAKIAGEGGRCAAESGDAELEAAAGELAKRWSEEAA